MSIQNTWGYPEVPQGDSLPSASLSGGGNGYAMLESEILLAQILAGTNAIEQRGARQDKVDRVAQTAQLHLVLTILTCGAWFPVWVICAVLSAVLDRTD